MEMADHIAVIANGRLSAPRAVDEVTVAELGLLMGGIETPPPGEGRMPFRLEAAAAIRRFGTWGFAGSGDRSDSDRLDGTVRCDGEGPAGAALYTFVVAPVSSINGLSLSSA
jgi:hypothetical protein